MMPQPKAVRFAPATTRNHTRSNFQDPPPVFSPSQTETGESVLHSVFSPTAKQAPDAKKQRKLANEQSAFYLNQKNTTSSLTQASLVSAGKFPVTTIGGCLEQIHTKQTQAPANHCLGFLQQVDTTAPSADISPLSSSTNDVFFSPQSTLRAISPTSGQTQRTSSSFNALRDFTMLDVSNIEKCDSVDDLKNVIDVLHGEGRFKALLRKAKSRLDDIMSLGSMKIDETKGASSFVLNAVHNPPKENQSQSYCKLPPKSIAKSPVALGIESFPRRSISSHFSRENKQETSLSGIEKQIALEPTTTTLNDTDDSLVMSVSSDALEAYIEGLENASAAKKKIVHYTGEDRRLSSSSICSSPVAGKTKSLSVELSRLADTVVRMEAARVKDRKAFLEKLESLERSKSMTGDNAKALESLMERASESTLKLQESLEKLHTDSQNFQEMVNAERNARHQTFQDAQQLEGHLSRKVEELADRLVSAATRNENDTKGELKKKYEAAIAAKSQENEQLANSLRDTLQNLLVSLGKDKNEVHQMNRVQQKELVSTFAKNHFSSKAAMKALAQQVAVLETERLSASRDKHDLASQLEKSKNDRYELTKENEQLWQKIQTLSDELKKLKQYCEELRSNRHLSKTWTEQEQQYLKTISSLKSQLRKEETMVSVGLYKSVVDSNRSKEKAIEAVNLRNTRQEAEIQQIKKVNKDALAMVRKKEAENEKNKQRVAELEREVQKERLISKQASTKAEEESNKHQSALQDLSSLQARMDRMEDIQWQMQESGSSLNMNGASRVSPSKNPEVQEAVSRVATICTTPGGKRGTLVTPITSRANKENLLLSPKAGDKQAFRNKFIKGVGGRKGLRQRVQQLRSPRACQSVVL